ncbi:hypothetical protein PCE1_002236 [Barthelona sp. PCE]
MPRIRKFEEDLIIKAYPEGQMIFEDHGLRLLKSRENTDITPIESTVEGKNFVGYVESVREPLKYFSKRKTGRTRYVFVEKIFNDDGILLEFNILFFNDIMSDDHTSIRIPYPFVNSPTKFLSSNIVPLNEDHLLFTIKDTDNRLVKQCYILNVLTEKYRCLGEYTSITTKSSNFIVLKKPQDNSIWHYKFSTDDMDEAHNPDIKQIDGIHSRFYKCLNSDCICSARIKNHKIDELTILDSQSNQIC